MKSETKKKASASCKGKKKAASNFMYTDELGQTVYLEQYGNRGSGLFRVRVRKAETAYGSVVVAAESSTIAAVIAQRALNKNHGLGFEITYGLSHCDIMYYTDHLNVGSRGPAVSHIAGTDKDEVNALNELSQRLWAMNVRVGDLRKILKSCDCLADGEFVPQKTTVKPKGPVPPEAAVRSKVV